MKEQDKELDNNSNVSVNDGSIVVAQSNNVTITQNNTINRSAKSVTLISIVALFITAIIVLSIVLPLTLINRNGNNGNGGDDDRVYKLLGHSRSVSMYPEKLLEVFGNKGIRFFSETDTLLIFSIDSIHASRQVDAEDENIIWGYRARLFNILTLDSDGNPLGFFEIEFRILLNDDYQFSMRSSTFGNNLVNSFDINGIEVRHDAGNRNSANFAFEYNDIGYFISIENGLPDMFGIITELDVKMLIDNLFE